MVVGVRDEGFVKSMVSILPSRTNEISEIIDMCRGVVRSFYMGIETSQPFAIVAILSAICKNDICGFAKDFSDPEIVAQALQFLQPFDDVVSDLMPRFVVDQIMCSSWEDNKICA